MRPGCKEAALCQVRQTRQSRTRASESPAPCHSPAGRGRFDTPRALHPKPEAFGISTWTLSALASSVMEARGLARGATCPEEEFGADLASACNGKRDAEQLKEIALRGVSTSQRTEA